MDRKNIRAMVNLTGGYDKGLGEAIARYDRAFPERFYTFTEPSYERSRSPTILSFRRRRSSRRIARARGA